MSHPKVMLRKDWKGTFSRTIRDSEGKAVDRLTFNPGEVVEIRPEEMSSIKRDLGKALQPVEWNEDLRKHVVIEADELDLDSIPDVPKGPVPIVTDRERGPDKPKLESKAKATEPQSKSKAKRPEGNKGSTDGQP